MKSSNVIIHQLGVYESVRQLRRLHCSIELMPQTNCEYDILVNNHTRVEVKVTDSLAPWSFNIHRHGIIGSERIDYFVFIVKNATQMGLKNGLYLIVPSRYVTKKSFRISPCIIFKKWHSNVSNWKEIASFAPSPNS